MKTCDFAVLIGRFQPFHIGHKLLFEHAASIADHVIIILGSHNAPASIRNPWNSIEREHFIRASLTDYDARRYTVAPVADSAYNFNDWLIRVQQRVFAIANAGRISIVGHYKDDTSFYLNYFPQWKQESLPTQAGGVNSTTIRTACFEGNIAEVKVLVAPQVYAELCAWTESGRFKQLQEEYQFIRNYRKKWESAPFPPTLVTADAVVMALGHVLLIKRKCNPGRGRYALPGGFVNQGETIEKACLRELKEETGLATGNKELHGSIKMHHVFDHPLRDPRGRVVTHAFMFELNVKQLPEVKGRDDAVEAFWLPLYRLESCESDFFNDHAQIVKYFINRMQ
jgi:bifunctional NMN adenylyltransferase/nudix hydrolase